MVLSPASPASATNGATKLDGYCMLDVWSTDSTGKHLSKIGNNTLNIGLEITAMTDCEDGFNLSIDGVESGRLQGGGVLVFSVSTTTHQIDFIHPNGTSSFQNLTFYPSDMMGQAIEFYEHEEKAEGDYWTADNIRSHEFFVALLTVFSSLLCSLFVVERISGYLHSRSVGREITGDE